MPRLVQLVSRAPLKLLKELDLYISCRFLRIGFETNMFPRNERGDLRVNEFFDCVCRFVLSSDRESRAVLHKYFPLLVEKAYLPFEGEPPLVRMVLETLFRLHFVIPANVFLPLKHPVGLIKMVPGWESLIRDPAV
jgi:hypothetical protein